MQEVIKYSYERKEKPNKAKLSPIKLCWNVKLYTSQEKYDWNIKDLTLHFLLL